MLALLLLALAAAPDGGRVKYDISPCSILGRVDGGLGGTLCSNRAVGGWDEETAWDDGCRMHRRYRRTDGGMVVESEVTSPDGGVPRHPH